MATGTLTNGSAWHDSFTLTKPSGTTLTLSTQEQYTDKNIQLTLNAQTATPSFSGGGLSNQTIATSLINVKVAATDTSGIAFYPRAYCTVDDVIYNKDVEGWVSATNGSIAQKGFDTSWSNGIRYITGVTLGLGKSFDIAVPNDNGAGYIAFRFMVDSLGNTTITTTDQSATIPPVNSADNGKILEVVDGAWAKVSAEHAMGGEY